MIEETTGLVNIESATLSISQDKIQELVHDDKVISLYNEILEDIDKDSNIAIDTFNQIYEMVINGGDASAASKEAMVNLLKLKSDMVDKKAKILEQFVRIKLKDAFPRYLNQKNVVVNNNGIDKRKLLEEASEDESQNK